MVRWGDYTNTVVDPVNDIDMWTIQEYSATDVGPAPDDDRWGTWWGRIEASAVRARLALTVTDSPDLVTVGTNLVYRITATNNGPNVAADVLLTDTLPAGVLFVSIASSQGSCSGTSNISCNLGALANGEAATITLVVRPWTLNVVDNTVSVTSATSDQNSSNNTEVVSTTLNDPPPRLSYSWLLRLHWLGF